MLLHIASFGRSIVNFMNAYIIWNFRKMDLILTDFSQILWEVLSGSRKPIVELGQNRMVGSLLNQGCHLAFFQSNFVDLTVLDVARREEYICHFLRHKSHEDS